MKTIVAKIEGERVMIARSDVPEIELNLVPAWKNWDLLRSKGFKSCDLVGEVSEQGWLYFHLPETAMDKLHVECANYDWYYEMSDDYGVYNAGRAKDVRIKVLIGEVAPPQAGIAVWQAYVHRAKDNWREPEQFLKDYLSRFGKLVGKE